MEETTRHTECLNCKTPFPEQVDNNQELFCASCGQSSKDSRLSFGRLIKDAVSNVFNLDGRLIHTFRDIFYPSKLTRSYIEGRRKYYVNPARLFIFMLIALITLALSIIKLENSNMGVDEIYSKAERSKMFDEYNALVDTLNITGHELLMDALKSKLFRRVNSLKKDTLGKGTPEIFNLAKSVGSYGISTYDGIHLTQNEVFEKYKVEGFWNKINVGQFIRIRTNPAGGIKYVIKNLTWTVFITVLLISFLMKLLYIRNAYYLVEHVVLILNSHSLLFLIAAINIAILVYFPLGNKANLITPLTIVGTFVFILVLQYRTLKKYYKQGFLKTIVKQILINWAYMFIFNMVFLTVAIISLILY